MTDVLSQSEVESLLAALDPGTPSSGVIQSERSGMQVTIYDFKRPERVSKEQIRALQALHEGFSREFGAGLSGMLRTICEVKLISVDQLTYNEFVFSLESPTCFNLLKSAGLEGPIILDLNPSIVFPIIDRLLGGGRDHHHEQMEQRRPLSDIELKLTSRVTSIALRALENAWSSVCSLDLTIEQVESNPQLVQIVPPNEVVVLISFEVAMADTRGILNLCIPFNTIEARANRLTSDNWAAYRKKEQDESSRLNMEGGLSRAEVEVTVRLAETTLSTREVMNLEVGDVILTEHDVSQGIEVLVAGRPVFLGFPGVYKGQKAIRISTQLEAPKAAIARQLGGAGGKPS